MKTKAPKGINPELWATAIACLFHLHKWPKKERAQLVDALARFSQLDYRFDENGALMMSLPAATPSARNASRQRSRATGRPTASRKTRKP